MSEAARDAAYEAENRADCARAGRTLCWIWIAVTPPFIAVDLARFPIDSVPLLHARIVSFVITLGFLAVLYAPAGRRRPRHVVLLFGLFGAAMTFAMMRGTGGHASPYFAGVGLVMLGTALLMPWSAAWTWGLCGGAIALYLAVAAIALPYADGRLFLNNFFSYVATAMIAGFATAGRSRLRVREFRSRWALERNQELLREQADFAAALARASRETIESLDPAMVVERLCHVTAEVLRCDVSHVMLYDHAKVVWRAMASHGDTPEEWERLRRIEVPADAGRALVERVDREGIVQLAPRMEPSLPRSIAEAAHSRSAMLAALRRGGEIVGVLTAGRRSEGEPFGGREERILLGIAQVASIALANALLHEELARQREAERAARAEAEAASTAKDAFLATLSHELRTPLNLIVGYIEMAQDPALDEDGVRSLLSTLDVVSRQLVDMVGDALEISRLQAGLVEAHREDVRLREFWEGVHARCAKLPRRSEVAVEWRLDDGDVLFATDPRRLFVVLRNLVSNAFKFTERGRVIIAAAVEGGSVVFRVEDTGIGIPESARERIFEMFQQVDGSSTRRFGGVGLGLYIVRRFVEQLGATIELESVDQRGSAFTVRLPLGRCEGRDAAAAAAP